MTASINGTTGVTFPDASVQATAAIGFGFKNRIINGGMVIDQRNAGASVTPADKDLMTDRWKYESSQASKFTAQQNAGSLTPPAGFSNYLGMTVASSVSVGSSDYFILEQKIEGLNIADLAWGTANAQPITISFWVRSSLTGTFSGGVANSAYNRSYVFNYSISSANTWEQKTVTITGDTTGTWLTTNGTGLHLRFNLGAGSTYSGSAGSWGTSAIWASTGSVSVVGTNGATFYITGVQLEKGSTATSFDYRPYGTELALCQRYYEQSYSQGTVAGGATYYGAEDFYFGSASTGFLGITPRFKVEKRVAPTVTLYDGVGASGKVYKGANGKTGSVANQATGSFFGYTTDATSANEMAYQWVAVAEL